MSKLHSIKKEILGHENMELADIAQIILLLLLIMLLAFIALKVKRII